MYSIRECFLLIEVCLSIQDGRSRDRQLERLDFLDSIDILIEILAARLLLSIKIKISDFAISH